VRLGVLSPLRCASNLQLVVTHSAYDTRFATSGLGTPFVAVVACRRPGTFVLFEEPICFFLICDFPYVDFPEDCLRPLQLTL